MTGFTHLTFSLMLFGSANPVDIFLVGAGSLFPDIDLINSGFQKNSKNGVSFKHRGIMHTPFLALCIFLFYYMIFRNYMIFPFIIGYLSHIFLDFLTVSGVPILYPISKNRFNLMRIKTGSSIDKNLGILFLFLFVLRFLKLF